MVFIPLRSCALALLVAASAAVGCSSDLHCGAGTVRDGSECVVVGDDARAGADAIEAGGDAAVAHDAASMDVATADASDAADAGLDVAMTGPDAAPDAAPDVVIPVDVGPIDVVFPPDTTSADDGGTVPDDFTDLDLTAFDGPVTFPHALPLGLGITFGTYASYADGTSVVLTHGVSYRVVPDDGTAVLRPHDGVVDVVMTRDSPVQLVATATTASGFGLTSSLRISGAVVAASPRLVSFTVPTNAALSGTLYWREFENTISGLSGSMAPILPTVAPVGGSVQVVTALIYDDTYPIFGGGTTTRPSQIVLDPVLVTVTPDVGTIAASNQWTVATAGTTGATVTYTPTTGGPLTARASARFVAPSAVTGLLITPSPVLVRWTTGPAWTVSTAPAGSVNASSFTSPPAGAAAIAGASIGFTTAGLSTTEYLAAVHGAGADAYAEWLPWSAVAFRAIEGGASVVVEAGGVFLAGTPGVAALALTADGFELPFVVETYYPFGTLVRLRVAPTTLNIALPSHFAPAVCASVTGFITPTGGVERPLTAIETLALTHDTIVTGLTIDTMGHPSTDLCVDWFIGAPRMATANYYYLGGHAPVMVTATPG